MLQQQDQPKSSLPSDELSRFQKPIIRLHPSTGKWVWVVLCVDDTPAIMTFELWGRYFKKWDVPKTKIFVDTLNRRGVRQHARRGWTRNALGDWVNKFK